ncbi:hypothetical protein GGP77_002562 [Salinibacter ruber]|nr:hypothetical protein [Salinibacter ruber]
MRAPLARATSSFGAQFLRRTILLFWRTALLLKRRFLKRRFLTWLFLAIPKSLLYRTYRHRTYRHRTYRR